MKRSDIVMAVLKKLFPTANEIMRADDFYTAGFLFKVGYGKEHKSIWIEIKEADIDHVVSDLVYLKKEK